MLSSIFPSVSYSMFDIFRFMLCFVPFWTQMRHLPLSRRLLTSGRVTQGKCTPHVSPKRQLAVKVRLVTRVANSLIPKTESLLSPETSVTTNRLHVITLQSIVHFSDIPFQMRVTAVALPNTSLTVPPTLIGLIYIVFELIKLEKYTTNLLVFFFGSI
jgi:hypothetical protein